MKKNIIDCKYETETLAEQCIDYQAEAETFAKNVINRKAEQHAAAAARSSSSSKYSIGSGKGRMAEDTEDEQ